MKTIICVKMDETVSFKFTWNEKNSFVSHIGEIIQADQRNAKSGVVRLDASRKWSDEKGHSHYESRIMVPGWIKKAMDWAFQQNESKLHFGVSFQVECNALGMKPIVTGLTEEVPDTSWLNDLPNNKKEYVVTEKDKVNVEEKKADCLNQLRAMTKNRGMSTAS